MVSFGTVLLTAPSGMIKAVSLMAKPGTMGTLLRIETRKPVPFIKYGGETIEAPLNHVYIDSEVRAQEIGFFSVSLEHAKGFTVSHLNPTKPKSSIRSRLGTFNRGLVNIWPTLFRDTKRMFFRDGMVYVYITDHGTWKLDLQGCEMLDGGQPLERAMLLYPGLDRGLIGLVKRMLGQSQ